MSKNSQPQSLELYLAQIAHELRDLPTNARADEMREIEAHLRAMIEARGDVAGVLAQFGNPRRVGRDLRKSWERKQPESWWCFGEALMFTLNFFFFIGLPFIQAFNSIENLKFGVGISAFFLMFITCYLTGLISPKRNNLIIAGLLIFLFWPNFMNESLITSFWLFSTAVSLVVASTLGSYFGARHGRRLFSRIANVK